MPVSSRDLKHLLPSTKRLALRQTAKTAARDSRDRRQILAPSRRHVVVGLLLLPLLVFAWANWPGRVASDASYESLQPFELPLAAADIVDDEDAELSDAILENKLVDRDPDGSPTAISGTIDTEPFDVKGADQLVIVEPEAGELAPLNFDTFVDNEVDNVVDSDVDGEFNGDINRDIASHAAAESIVLDPTNPKVANIPAPSLQINGFVAEDIVPLPRRIDQLDIDLSEPFSIEAPTPLIDTTQPINTVSLAHLSNDSMTDLLDPTAGLASPSPESLPSPPLSDVEDNDWMSVDVEDGDNLWEIFKRVGIREADAVLLARAGGDAKALTRLIPGQQLQIKKDADGNVDELRYEINYASDLHAAKADRGFKVSIVSRDLEIQELSASNVISSSLFLSGQEVNIPDGLLFQLTTIFGWAIDFALDIREGDRFSLIYESKHWQGKRVRDGDIIAAEFVNNGKVYRAIRLMQDGKAHYYTPEGESLRRAFLRSPMEFTRITSRFTKRRFHPILKRWRAHRGVDYGAPTGTPVRATSDGKVHFRGKQRGYGNVVVLSHGRKYKTLYAHLSRFAKKTKQGKSVRQGDIIGYVGSTGFATGPHLHYEFRVNDKHVNPLTVKLPNSAPVPDKYSSKFRELASTYTARLDTVGPKTVVAGSGTNTTQ